MKTSQSITNLFKLKVIHSTLHVYIQVVVYWHHNRFPLWRDNARSVWKRI